MESIDSLVPMMQEKVKKQLKILQLEANFNDLRPIPHLVKANEHSYRCTINPCHVVKPSKIALHVVDCYEKYVGARSKKSKLVPEYCQCPFIGNHIIKREHYLSHIKFCKMNEIYLKATSFLDPSIQHIAPSKTYIPTSEDWDC